MIKNTKNTVEIFSITLKILFLIFIAPSAIAQNNSSSPYSRFGIGDMQSSGFTETDGMGTSSIALHEPFNINFSNPASYSSIKLTTFEFGATSNFTKFSSAGFPSNTTNTSNISYVALAFPVIANRWGASFGMMPFSNVGYKISDADTIGGTTENYLYTGSGGFNQLYFGNAVNICKSLSVGANISYLFGSIERQNTVEFPSLTSAQNTRITNTIHINDLTYKVGLFFTLDSIKVDSSKIYGPKHKLNVLQCTDEALVVANSKDTLWIRNKLIQLKRFEVMSNTSAGITFANERDTLYVNNTLGKLKIDTALDNIKEVKIKSDRSFSVGLTYSLNSSLHATTDSLSERYLSTSLGGVAIHDTINYTSGIKGRITLPMSLGFGIAYKKGQRLLLSAEASIQDWTKYTFYGQSDQLANSMKIAAGAQISPDLIQAKTFFKSITYRFGAYYSKTYLDLKSTQLDDIGITLGCSLPVFRSLSKINISMQAGQRGTLMNNLIREQYIRLGLGFSLSDRWFIKYKYE